VILQSATRFAPVSPTILVVGNSVDLTRADAVRIGNTLAHEIFWSRGADTIHATHGFMVASDRCQLVVDSIAGRKLGKPIVVTIECVDDREFIAAAGELNMAMSGESVGEALSSLRTHISDMHRGLQRADRLGPEPKRQLKILEEHFGEERRK
jgi:hypothetical protein